MDVKYVPAEISHLSDGEFLSDMQREFNEAKDALLAHVATHEKYIRKAKVVMTAEIEVTADNCDGVWVYRARVQLQHKRPKPPARGANQLLCRVGEGGDLDLFVQPAGATEDSPLQGRFAKADGTGLDLQTGQPSEERTLKIGAA